MSKFLAGTRYLILIPILGLAIAAATFFILGGIGLIHLLIDVIATSLKGQQAATIHEAGSIIFEVLEYVHTLLIGTVLYITAVGLYQLFIKEIHVIGWLKVESAEELENNLIGVVVVVLAVNFMGAVFAGNLEHLREYGIGIALPIAALGFFIGLRTWSAKLSHDNAEDSLAKKSNNE